MASSFVRTCTIVWLVLMALTLASALIFEGGLTQLGFSKDATTVTLLAIAFFKVRLVIVHFMEVGHAVIGLRIILEAWLLLTLCMILTFYFSPPILGLAQGVS